MTADKARPAQKAFVPLDNKTILVTGAAGFIGMALCVRLLADTKGALVLGLDDLNDYYSPALKEYRLSRIRSAAGESGSSFSFERGSVADGERVARLFETYNPSVVVHLAAQAGVRYSIDHPGVYIASNLTGFYNILEACRRGAVDHLVYASSSSVYGGNKKVPFSTEDNADHPVSLYAATKRSNELMAHAYSKLYDIPSTGLRFFTVYGPAGRPDMFYYSAAERLVRGERIRLFNHGEMKRDFTFIDDIVEGVVRVMRGAPPRAAGPDGLPIPPYALYNIGGGKPENLLDFIGVLRDELVRVGLLPAGRELPCDLVGMQPGDVPVTYADSGPLESDYGFRPEIGIREGLRRFVEWYKEYHISS